MSKEIIWSEFIDTEQVLTVSDEYFSELINVYEPNTLTIKGNCLLVQLAEHPDGNYNKFQKLVNCESVSLDRGKLIKTSMNTVSTKNLIDILSESFSDDSIAMIKLLIMNTNIFDEMLVKTDFKNTNIRALMLDTIKLRCKHNIKLTKRRSSNINILKSPQLSPCVKTEQN